MSDTNLALVLVEKGVIRVQDTTIPEPGPGEVQLAIDSVGICGTDVHFWQDGGMGDFQVQEPVVLGHEPSGTVTKVGEGVKHLKVGDRVAVEPGMTCHHCEFCKSGRYNLCPDMVCAGTPPTHGTLRRYHVHRAAFCFKLPDNLSFEEGALAQPLTIGIHACRRAGVKLGDSVLVCGAGPIGLLCLVTAKAMGAGFIAITDIAQKRLDVAKQFGATHTFLIQDRDSKVVADKIIALLGEKPNVTIECSGAEPSIQTAFYATRSGGVVQIVGIGRPTITIPMVHAATHEIDVRGTWRDANCYPIALAMLASGAVDLKPMITHRFKLEDAVEAFNVAKDPNSGSMKVMIKCSRD